MLEADPQQADVLFCLSSLCMPSLDVTC